MNARTIPNIEGNTDGIPTPPAATKADVRQSHSATDLKLTTMEGDSEMAALIRAYDWSQTPLGPVSSWPQSLRTSVSLILNSQHPMWIGWGPSRTFLYNDAYIQVLSLAKHPWALGRPAQEVWREIWDFCGPLVDKVFEKGEPSFLDDVRLFMSRGDYLEETYYSFSYSPILDESGQVGGLFCPSAEVTPKVLNARRLRTLSNLSADAFLEKSVSNACASAARTLESNPDDVPFALLFLLSPDGRNVSLQGRTDVPDGDWRRAFPSLDLDQVDGAEPGGFLEKIRGGQFHVIPVSHIDSLPLGPAQQKVKQALVLPIKSRAEKQALGILVAGVNPTRKLDEEYRTFYNLVADHIATAVVNARASEDERKQVQALAELDKAKTIFFSNVSHEFRTPLTLMLGSIEAARARPMYSEEERQDFELLHRNAMRLLKLVNTLLDFSRLEAGRVQAEFEPVDLARFTTELASVFGAAADKAGLHLRVDCRPLSEPVYVNRDMWEKIVLNLLSNALKSTFDGEIAVTLREADGHVELTVRDTGTGIAKEEIPHLFERFRRIEGARRRTHEGSGIGLALVYELVAMHGGSIAVSSVLHSGTTFSIRLPFGSDHLPPDRVRTRTRDRATAPGSAALYVQEALSWLPDVISDTEFGLDLGGTTSVPPEVKPSLATVLLVDDNHDMRDYVRRLLARSFRVKTAENGKAALDLASSEPPDLVLTDVMMPEMDGFQLLAALRRNPATSAVPVIILSARAGEEARVEGLQAGADDYLVKPFTARELLARVESHIRMAEFRRKAQQRELELLSSVQQARHLAAEALEHITDGFWIYDSEWHITYVNAAGETMSKRSREEQVGHTLWELFPDLVGSELEPQFRRAMENREMVEFEWHYEPWQRWYRMRVYPTPDGGVAVSARDSSEARLVEKALLRAEQVSAAGKLAASISHEINNPLEAVTNLLFLAKTSPELSDETKKLLGIADTELQRLSQIARTSLKFFRQSTAPASISVRDLIESVVTVFQPRITRLGINLRKHYEDTPELLCFPGELQQVFTNLISNSLDAMRRGGTLLVSVRPAPGGSQAGAKGIRVIVMDSGEGMDAQVRSKLFEPFFTTKGEAGTGLGLWVSKGIIDKHKGHIRVRSLTGKGTAVSVFLPFNYMQAAAS
ncbi:MAG: ATP-binding protein [Candidatus Korobacteraceae bacterium]